MFETFWANASYKSFATRPHLRESGLETDVENEAANNDLPLSSYTSPSSDEDAPSVVQDKRAPSATLTLHQSLYIIGSHGIGAMIISGGINFALAYGELLLPPRDFIPGTALLILAPEDSRPDVNAFYLAMYTTNDLPIRLFELPNTLIGDTGVTVIIQTIMTWVLEMIIVKRDLRKGNIQPIGFVSQPPKTNKPWWRMVRWFMQVEEFEGPPRGQKNIRRRLLGALGHAARAFVVAVICFCILFGPAVGALIAVGEKHGGDWDYTPKWTPEIFKLVLGSVLALMTSPIFAMIWMVKCGWEGGSHEAVTVRASHKR